MIVRETPYSSQARGKFSSSPKLSSVSQEQQDSVQTTKVIQGEKKKAIFDKFSEIKLKNEILKNNTYTQF